MSRARTYPIDGNKLKNLILTTGTTLPEASVVMGGSRDYLSGVCRTNKATAQCMSLIALTLNIPKELYLIKEPEPEVSHETEDDPRGIAQLLADIAKDVRKLVELMEEKENEQKTWNLPFGDPACGDRPDGRAGTSEHQ